MPRYEVILATRILQKESYKTLLRKYCEVIWKDQGVIRGISTMGSRDLPHALNIKTERGSEKIWKATFFSVDAMIREDTIEKLSTLADVDNNSIYSKVVTHRPSAPMWCNWREQKNVEFAASSERLKSFDDLLIEDEQTHSSV
eukprot:sb/3474061/